MSKEQSSFLHEGAQFLRYALPGLTVMTEMAAAIALFHQEKLVDAYKAMSQQSPLAAIAGLFLGTFVTSGSLGYILTNIYYALYWTTVECIGVDHRPVIDSLRKEKRFRILDLAGNDIKERSFSRREAWMIMCTYREGRRTEDKFMEGVVPAHNALADIYRGLGSTIVGTALFAVLYFVVVCGHAWQPLCVPDALALGYWLLLLFVFWSSYHYTQKTLEKLLNSAVVHDIRTRLEKDKVTPVTIYFQT